MTELDAEMIPLAYELAEEFGKSIEYKITGSSSYNIETQTSTPTETEVPNCKMFPPEDFGTYTTANSGGLIEQGDKKVFIPAQYFQNVDLVPSEEDIINFENNTWIVKKVEEIFSGEMVCLYQMQIRK